MAYHHSVLLGLVGDCASHRSRTGRARDVARGHSCFHRCAPTLVLDLAFSLLMPRTETLQQTYSYGLYSYGIFVIDAYN